MSSFDVVSQVDMQEVDNAVNNTTKELSTRYDFRGVKTELTLDKKEKVIRIHTADKMKMEAIGDILMTKAAKRGLDPRILNFKEIEAASMGTVRREVAVREGIDKDTARKIVKKIKEMGLKVQAAIQEDQVRVTGKQIDDLQSVIGMLKGATDIEVPMQYINMKS